MNLRNALCVLFVGVLAFPAHSTVRRKMEAEEAGSESSEMVPASPAVRNHLKRVQGSFAKSNDENWYREAFVAVVKEIRGHRSSDKLVGNLRNGASDVAVLQIRAVGRGTDERLQPTSVIAVPVENISELWKRWQRDRMEAVFEYSRVGKLELVRKVGC